MLTRIAFTAFSLESTHAPYLVDRHLLFHTFGCAPVPFHHGSIYTLARYPTVILSLHTPSLSGIASLHVAVTWCSID